MKTISLFKDYSIYSQCVLVLFDAVKCDSKIEQVNHENSE